MNRSVYLFNIEKIFFNTICANKTVALLLHSVNLSMSYYLLSLLSVHTVQLSKGIVLTLIRPVVVMSWNIATFLSAFYLLHHSPVLLQHWHWHFIYNKDTSTLHPFSISLSLVSPLILQNAWTEWKTRAPMPWIMHLAFEHTCQFVGVPEVSVGWLSGHPVWKLHMFFLK